MITYNVIDVKMPEISHRETTKWVRAVAASYGKRVGEVAYVFCNDDKILEVNRQYLKHDYFTDIITFDYCEGDMLSGDLFISLDTVRTNAELFHKLMTTNCIASSFTAYFTLSALTTKVQANVKSWKQRKIKPWICSRSCARKITKMHKRVK